MGNFSTLIRPRSVTGDGAGLVSHGGIVWLAETADLAGLTGGLSAAMRAVPQRRHDPGRTLAQMVLALADGATCLADLAGVREQRSMFGPVASEATVWRTFDQIGPVELRGIDAARATDRARAWAAGAGPTDDLLVIDFDATLIDTRADKQGQEVSDRVSESRIVLATGEIRTQQPDHAHQPAMEGASAPYPAAVIATATSVTTLGTSRRRLRGMLADYLAGTRSRILADR